MDWHLETVDIIALLKIELCAFLARFEYQIGTLISNEGIHLPQMTDYVEHRA